MLKVDTKKLCKLGFIVFVVMLFSIIAFYFFTNYQKNLEIKRQILCHELGVDYSYDAQINECKKVNLEEKKDNQEPKYLCEFSIDYISKEIRNIDGLDLELIADLEKKCQGGEGILSKFACLNLETEKNKEYHKTYFDLEGILKTNGDEYLKLIGVEINTVDKQKILLGWEVLNLEKNVKSGEEVPFSLSVLID